MSTQILTQVLIIFLLAIVVNIVCSRFKLPVTVGFLLTGVLCGPSVLGFVSDMEVISSAADLGVAMLMFTIGMELSGEVLDRLKRPVFLGGSLQIGLIIGVAAVVGLVQGHLAQGIFWGCLFALSSSAIMAAGGKRLPGTHPLITAIDMGLDAAVLRSSLTEEAMRNIVREGCPAVGSYSSFVEYPQAIAYPSENGYYGFHGSRFGIMRMQWD